MDSRILYVFGIFVSMGLGGIIGHLVISYFHPFPKNTHFRKRIEEIDSKMKEAQENPVMLLEAEIEKMNERIENLERRVLNKIE